MLIPFGNQREAPYLCNMKRKLIVDIETMMKFKPQTHKDFILLSNRIMDSTQQYVSATTLKRVWGCKHDYNSPSQFTLNVLSRFLGFADFEHYCTQEKTSVSDFYVNTFQTCNLTAGDELELSWHPDRKLALRYLGDDRFEVIASENGKLCIGDTVGTKLLIEGEPVTFTDVTHQGRSSLVYIAGKSGGIHIAPTNNLPDEQYAGGGKK